MSLQGLKFDLYIGNNIAQKRKGMKGEQKTIEADGRMGRKDIQAQSTEAEFLIPRNFPLWFFLHIRQRHAFRSDFPDASASAYTVLLTQL